MLAKNKSLRFHSANFLLAELRSLVIQTHVAISNAAQVCFLLTGSRCLQEGHSYSREHLIGKKLVIDIFSERRNLYILNVYKVNLVNM